MTAPRITEYDMDVHAEAIDEYARYGGLRPGMIPGPKTELPIPVPEPAEGNWQALKPGLFGTGVLIAAVLFVATVAEFLSALVGGVLR